MNNIQEHSANKYVYIFVMEISAEFYMHRRACENYLKKIYIYICVYLDECFSIDASSTENFIQQRRNPTQPSSSLNILKYAEMRFHISVRKANCRGGNH